MKKLILSLSLIVIIFSSCSKNDDTVTNVTTVSQHPPGPSSNLPFPPVVSGDLLKKIVQNGFTYVYTYNGKKVDRITENDGKYTVYTYNADDLITKIQPYNSDGSSITEGTYEFGYGNDLIKVKDINLGTSIEGKYNMDNNNEYFAIVDLTYGISVLGQKKIVTIPYNTSKYQSPGSNGNGTIFTREDSKSYSLKYINQAENFSGNYKIDYIFDNKYSPFFNVYGMKILSQIHFGTGLYHNLIMSKKGTEPEVKYTYTYNTNGFPLSRTSTDTDKNCTYEYY